MFPAGIVRRLGLILVVPGLLASACGEPVVLPNLAASVSDPTQIAHEAADGLRAAEVLHVQAIYDDTTGQHFAIDAVEAHARQARGAFRAGAASYEFVSNGDQLAYRGKDVWVMNQKTALARYIGDRWVVPKANRADLVRTLDAIAPEALGSLIGSRNSLRRISDTTVNDVPAAKFNDEHGSVWITIKRPYRLLRAVMARPVGDGLQSFAFDLLAADPGQVDFTVPGGLVNFDDPRTLPARFQAETVSFGTCDQAGCQVRAAVRNKAGKAVIGQPMATMDVQAMDGRKLGTCSAPIAASDYDQVQTVACVVRGPAWEAFARVGGKYSSQVRISNPAYDPA